MKKLLLLWISLFSTSIFAETITFTGLVSTNGNGSNPSAGVILQECKMSGASCVDIKNGREFVVYTKNYTKLDKANCAAGTVCTVTGTIAKDGNSDFQLIKITSAKKIADTY